MIDGAPRDGSTMASMLAGLRIEGRHRRHDDRAHLGDRAMPRRWPEMQRASRAPSAPAGGAPSGARRRRAPGGCPRGQWRWRRQRAHRAGRDDHAARCGTSRWRCEAPTSSMSWITVGKRPQPLAAPRARPRARAFARAAPETTRCVSTPSISASRSSMRTPSAAPEAPRDADDDALLRHGLLLPGPSPSSSQIASTRRDDLRRHRQHPAPFARRSPAPILLVASMPSLPPRPGFGEAKSR